MKPIVVAAPQVPASTPPAHPAAGTPAAGIAARRTREGGPPPLVPALAFGVLTVAGAVLGAGVPRPAATAAEVLTYDTAHPTVISVAAALLLGSTLPLVITAVTLYRRLRRLGVYAPGPLMGVTGAVLAATALAASALFSWTATQSAGLGDPTIARVLATLSFASGGVGFVAPFGLLLAGIAVPALILRLLPSALAWVGLAVAVLAMLTPFALISDALYPLLPVGRFGGVLFLIATATLLPLSPQHRR